jgi:glycosyltransferase involved in cell wall biosynthesis
LTAKLPGGPQDDIRIIETNYKDVLSSIKSSFGFDEKKGIQEQLNIHISKDYIYPTLKSKIIKASGELIAYPDAHQGWCKSAIKSACELLAKEKIDVIISTSPPATSHIIAREIKKSHQIPWVADLRDPWTQHQFYNKFNFIRHLERRLELKTLSLADSLVTVTPEFADNLKLLHKNKDIYCITNGFDVDNFAGAQTKLTDKFTITYTGLCKGRRDPSLLFEALSMLIGENKIDRKLLEVRFYGPQQDWLLDDIQKYNLDDIVTLYGAVSREEALEKQKESQILLLLLDKNNKEKDVYPAKIFEYFGARRPIIAFGGSGDALKKLLDKTSAGEFAVDKGALTSVLHRHYQQFVSSGEVSCSTKNIDNYIYKNIAKEYAEILNEIVKK